MIYYNPMIPRSDPSGKNDPEIRAAIGPDAEVGDVSDWLRAVVAAAAVEDAAVEDAADAADTDAAAAEIDKPRANPDATRRVLWVDEMMVLCRMRMAED